MDKVFLTGATGFIGSHVMKQLLARGNSVVALSRKGSEALHLQGLSHGNLQVVRGDLLKPDTYAHHLKGCTALIHSAGWISTQERDFEQLRQINVVATEELWKVCQSAELSKIVYLASIFAHGWGENGFPSREEDDFDERILKLPIPYVKAKREAELLSWRYQETGLPIVFAYPGYCVGPGDHYLSSSEVILRYLKGELPFYVNGGMNFMDVRDCATALISCLEKGRVGEKYLTVGYNLSWRDFLLLIEKATGIRLSAKAIPKFMSKSAMRMAKRAQKVATLPYSAGDIALISYDWWYDPRKSMNELDLPRRPLLDSVADAAEWLKVHKL